jgi:hypothetical protein
MSRRHKRRVRDSKTAPALTGGGAVTYIELTARSQTSLSSIHLKYDATLAATFAYQTSNLEEAPGDAVGATGEWVTESSVTIAAAASSAAGQMIHIGNDGALRKRLAVTTTTVGLLDIATCEVEQ